MKIASLSRASKQTEFKRRNRRADDDVDAAGNCENPNILVAQIYRFGRGRLIPFFIFENERNRLVEGNAAFFEPFHCV